MLKILYNLKTFIKLLREGKSLKVTSEGEFSLGSFFTMMIRKTFGLSYLTWVEISQAFRSTLHEMESIPVLIDSKGTITVPYNSCDVIEAGNLILEKMKPFNNERVKNELARLKRDLIAFQYRIEPSNGGLAHTTVYEAQFESILAAAQSWKSSQVMFQGEILSDQDIQVLKETCQFKEFVSLILGHVPFLYEFFEWALRDRISIQTFIEYPSLAKKLKDFDLTGRIGRMGGHLLKVQKVHCEEDPKGFFEKFVTLPMEGRDRNILDGKKCILFRGNYCLTIDEIFDEFAKKRTGSSNLEFMAEGIINWNSFYWGWWNAEAQKYELVDFEKNEWWKQLPILETLSLKDVRKKFGTHLDGRQWNIAAIATRERSTLDFEGAHAYSSIAIPQCNGSYVVYPFGKFAMQFPPTLLEALLNIGHTSNATVSYPDENTYYTHRQRSRYSFAATEAQGLTYLESVKKDMLLSRCGNFIYQIESENCAKWAHHKIEEIVGPHRIPNVFQMPFLHSEPHGFMENVFAGVHFFPEKWHVNVTLCIHFLLGAYKGVWIWEEGKRVWKSLTHHPFWQDTVIYHPSMLHRQQEAGLIGNFVPLGVTFSKQQIHMTFHKLYHKMVLFPEFSRRATAKFLNLFLSFFYAFFQILGKNDDAKKGTIFLRNFIPFLVPNRGKIFQLTKVNAAPELPRLA